MNVTKQRVLGLRMNYLAPIVLGAVAGLAVLVWTQVSNGSAEDSFESGGVPVSESDFGQALAAAESKVGFAPWLPTSFPTSANRLVLVDASTGPEGAKSGLPLIELIYSDTRGQTSDSGPTLEMFQMNFRLSSAKGEPFAADLAGFEVHRDVVDRDATGVEQKVTYTARNADWTFVMDFTGSQPDEDGLGRMLDSLEQYEP